MWYGRDHLFNVIWKDFISTDLYVMHENISRIGWQYVLLDVLLSNTTKKEIGLFWMKMEGQPCDMEWSFGLDDFQSNIFSVKGWFCNSKCENIWGIQSTSRFSFKQHQQATVVVWLENIICDVSYVPSVLEALYFN